jgi:nucleoside-diphosphate-sugar epimerase
MILLTGSSGFLGQLILNYVNEEEVKTLSRNAVDYPINLAIEVPIFSSQFKTVIHSAGKAHLVPKNENQKKEFYDVNVKGTLNLLKGLEQSPAMPQSFVFISSVAVYGIATGNGINENTPLLANDPYGNSKIQAEKLIEEWCKSNNVICTILRLPLLVGTNPPGNLGSMIKAIKKGYYFNIAGGAAKKSMVLATDIVKVIFEIQGIGGTYNLTDRQHPSFSQLSAIIANQLNKSRPFNMNKYFAKFIAVIGDIMGGKLPLTTDKLNKITADLTFDDKKAVNAFGWNPTPVLQGFNLK